MSVLRHLVPKRIRTPFARYSHAVEVPAGARWLLCSGQLGISTSDEIPEKGRLVVDVDSPAWSTEMQFQEALILARCREELGENAPARLRVRVRRPGTRPSREG